MNQWLSMGGYGVYVWPAYGLVTLVLIMNVVRVAIQKKQTRKQLKIWFEG